MLRSLRMRRAIALCSLLAIVAAATCGERRPSHRALGDALARGKLDEVRTLLERGVDPDTWLSRGMTALHWAAKHDDEPLIRLLVAHGATLDATFGEMDITPLQAAILDEHEGAATVLLELWRAIRRPSARLGWRGEVDSDPRATRTLARRRAGRLASARAPVGSGRAASGMNGAAPMDDMPRVVPSQARAAGSDRRGR
jgi:hypothetical protein